MAQKAADQTNKAIEQERKELENVTEWAQDYLNSTGNQEIDETIPEEPAEEFSRANGNVDVVFVNQSNIIISANAVPTPKISDDMVPVKWNEIVNSWYVCKTTDNWYNYQERQWANVMFRDGLVVEGIADSSVATIDEMAGKKVTTEGSMFVYIPRYAYKIEYTTEDGNTVLGYSNSVGIVDVEGRIVPGTEKEEAKKVGNKYVLHLAFTSNSNNGGWSSDIPGIWVAKFEASSVQGNSNSTSGDNVTTKTIQVKPGVASWRSISVNDIYTKCTGYNSTLNSHMMKNSEWGACAYLSKSIYGINGEITINSNSSYYTGGGTGTAYVTNTAQSTTGNVYGIYDMSGCSWEYVASYVDNGNSYLTTYGSSLVSGATNMKQVYSKGSTDDRELNYQANSSRYGDAVYETSTAGTSSTSWYGDYSDFPCSTYPFFVRGGYYNGGSYAGAFAFNNGYGISSSSYSFRPVLVAP